MPTSCAGDAGGGEGAGAGPASFTNANATGGLTPVTEAVTMYPPVTSLARKAGATATPDALVVTLTRLVPVVAKVPLAPVDGALKVTVAPGTGFLSASLTVTDSGMVKVEPTGDCCVTPAPGVTLDGAAARLVRVNTAGLVTPWAVAVTVKVPATSFAWIWGETAKPFESVATLALPPAPTKVPLAALPPPPPDPAENVTMTFCTGLPFASVTRAS